MLLLLFSMIFILVIVTVIISRVIHSYISGVLIKESLIFLLMKKSGKIYNECDELCKSSEVNKTEELRKRKK